MEKFEQQPNLKDAQAQTSQAREQFEQERDIRAKERNRYRTIWQKIFGIGETSEMDIAIEEALRMDAEIEALLNENKVASTTEAIKVIERDGKFGLKGKEKISKEEWVRFKTLQFGKALDKNDFGKASEIIYQTRWEDTEKRQILKETIAPLITQKVAELVQNKDGKNFVRAFYELGRLQPITAESLSREGLQSPEIQDAIKKHLISYMRTNPGYFAEYQDKWVQLGIVDAKALSNLSEIQNIAKNKLIDYMRISPEYFAEYRDKWAQLGIVDAKTLSNLSEIQQNIAKDKLIGYMRISPEYFAKYRDKWAQLGIVDAKALNNLSEIQNIAKDKLIGYMRISPRYFAKYRDKWAQLGIVDASEINALEEIQKIAKEKLLSYFRINPRYFAKYRDSWAQLGIVNAEEANRWVTSKS